MVLQHIRYAHYQGVGGSSNTNSLTISSTNFTSGGQVVATDGPSLPPPLPTSIPSAIPAFRCGVCNQVSNWKHVIQVPFNNWIETYFFDGRPLHRISFSELDLFISFFLFFFSYFEPHYQRNSFSLTQLEPTPTTVSLILVFLFDYSATAA